jgi:phenylacetate-CoA ligase
MNPSRYLSRSKFPVTAQAHTSGTTGSPITIKVEARSIAAREETQRRGRQWWGHKRGQRTIKLSGRLEPIGWRRLQWDRWIENIHYVDAYKLTGREGYDFYTRLLRTPHSLVYGYASALSELARYWYERGWTVPSGWLKMVILTGDMASAQQKALIESVFGAPTVSEYGCTEFYVIAMECPDGGWHLETDRLLVEIIDENGRLVPPFTPGQVVITGFDTKAMPLIRYPLGDMATYSSRPCVCGRSLPLLNDVLGRENDYIELPSGGRAPGLAMSTVLESAYANIGQPLLPWRGIQKSRDLIHFLLTEKQTSKALEDSVRVELQKLDSRFVARFEYVPTLQWREGQKRARFVSEIKLAVEVR